MKKKHLFAALAAICAGFSFASCSNDIDDVAGIGQLADPTRGVSLDITKVGTINVADITRATATEVNTWATAPDKNIGVSVYSSADGTLAMKPGSVNMKWTYNGGNWETQNPLHFFPGDEGVVTAYYPYSETADPKAVDIDATKDYMYALIGDNKTVNYGAPQTSLLMHHTNAQIRVYLIRKGYAGQGTGNVTAFSVKSSKFASAGKLNSLTGVISNHVALSQIDGTPQRLLGDVENDPTNVIEVVSAWFVPITDAAAPVTFDATVDGLKLRYTTSLQFQSGKRYTFTLAVTDNLGSELALTSVDIDSWIDENNDGDLELNNPYNGHQYVDLGLPSGLKWARCNVGAENETDPGLYFAWGETTGHEKNSGYKFTRANYNAKGLNAISTNLALAQDAANANMGGDWRMPTNTEFEELYNNTNVTWTTINGVSGRKFANKTDASKYIFMPAAGFYKEYSGGGEELLFEGTSGNYWSSTFDEMDDEYPFGINFESTLMETGIFWRYDGYSVRAVCE